MSIEELRDSPCGHLAPTINSAMAFVPDPLPPKLSYEPLVSLLSEASMKLGELNGIGQLLVNPYLLIRPLQRTEAVASSNIEGTYTSLSDLFLLEAGADESARPPETREVLNYVQALEHAVARMEALPVSLRLMKEVHRILLSGVRRDRGARLRAGEFRRDQNWIGGSGSDIRLARFVPPPPQQIMRILGELEKFIQNPIPPDLPPLIHLALIHYQFETIHPFLDGNGRLGRLLIPVILCERKVLEQPLLYMSPYFERNKDEYIDRLFQVSKDGAWLEWIGFFLRGVIESSKSAVVTVRKLQDLNAQYRAKIQQARISARAIRLVDLIFEEPYLTIPRARKLLGVSYPSAKSYVEKLIDAGMLIDAGISTRPKFYVAHEVYEILLDSGDVG